MITFSREEDWVKLDQVAVIIIFEVNEDTSGPWHSQGGQRKGKVDGKKLREIQEHKGPQLWRYVRELMVT